MQAHVFGALGNYLWHFFPPCCHARLMESWTAGRQKHTGPQTAVNWKIWDNIWYVARDDIWRRVDSGEALYSMSHFIVSITHSSTILDASYKECFILSAWLCYSDLDLIFVWIFVFPPNLLCFLVPVHLYPVEYWLPSTSVKLNWDVGFYFIAGCNLSIKLPRKRISLLG